MIFHFRNQEEGWHVAQWQSTCVAYTRPKFHPQHHPPKKEKYSFSLHIVGAGLQEEGDSQPTHIFLSTAGGCYQKLLKPAPR